MEIRQRVAVFDVDCTLLKGDCLWIAIRRSNGLGQIIFQTLACFPLWISWKLGFEEAGRVKQQTISAFRLCEKTNRFKALGREDWLLDELLADLRPEALHRLRWHQERGDRVLLCSASPRMFLEPLAEWLGVELLCTELEQSHGFWRPKLASANCKGPEKLRRLEEYLGSLKDLSIEVYGDSKGDRELLQAAELPHYRSFSMEPRPYPSFRIESLILVVAIALLAYGVIGIKSQGDELLPLLRSLWPQITLGLLLVLLAYVIRYCRWRLLLAVVKQYPPIPADARIWMGSYAFTATPGKSGEAVRSLLLKEECGVPVPPSLMALLVERLTDGIAVALLLILNFSALIRLQVPLFLPLILLVLLAILGGLLLRNSSTKNVIRKIIMRFLPRRFAAASYESMVALKQLLDLKLILVATIIALLAWCLEGICFWLLLNGMGVDNISIGGSIFIYAASCLVGVLTFLPGGLGTTEAATVGLLAFQGVTVSLATPVTILIRLMTLWFVTFIGIICLMVKRNNRLNVKERFC